MDDLSAMAHLNSFEERALAWLEQHVQRRAPSEDVRWGEGVLGLPRDGSR